MVQTVPTGRGQETVEVSPPDCPECGSRKIWPYWTGCDSADATGHRYWVCQGCGLELIDGYEHTCSTPGRRWP